MKKIRLETKVRGNFQAIYQKFDRNLFEKLAGPVGKMHILRFDGIKEGDEVQFNIHLFGKIIEWHGVILATEANDKELSFTDIGKKLPVPLISWQHQHVFKKIDENTTLLGDYVNFECGSKILESFLLPVWYSYFVYRSFQYKRIFN